MQRCVLLIALSACMGLAMEDDEKDAVMLLQRGVSQGTEIDNDHAFGACDWFVDYDRFIGGFDAAEFDSKYGHETDGAMIGMHCLRACCEDVHCHGISTISSLETQCYKYSQLPEMKHLDALQPLRDFFPTRSQVKPAWSIFVKRNHVETPIIAKADGACQWEVHYGTWVATFEPNEFERDLTAGKVGDQCLHHCCEDPDCTGLSMDTSFDSQCYKYKNEIPGLKKGYGRPLGDRAWLKPLPHAFSVFRKVSVFRAVPEETLMGKDETTTFWQRVNSLHIYAMGALLVVVILVRTLRKYDERTGLLFQKKISQGPTTSMVNTKPGYAPK